MTRLFWAVPVLAAVVLMAIGLERTLFFAYSPEPLLVERRRLGNLFLLAGTVASIVSALWSYFRGHPPWITVCVLTPAVLIGGLSFLMPLTLIPQAAALLALPAALAGLAGGLGGRHNRPST